MPTVPSAKPTSDRVTNCRTCCPLECFCKFKLAKDILYKGRWGYPLFFPVNRYSIDSDMVHRLSKSNSCEPFALFNTLFYTSSALATLLVLIDSFSLMWIRTCLCRNQFIVTVHHRLFSFHRSRDVMPRSIDATRRNIRIENPVWLSVS